MDPARISSELEGLIDDLDDRVGHALREYGSRLADELTRHLRPVEELLDELYFDQRYDERSVRVAQEAIATLHEICTHLPHSTEDAMDRSAYDRLRALRVDIDLGYV